MLAYLPKKRLKQIAVGNELFIQDASSYLLIVLAMGIKIYTNTTAILNLNWNIHIVYFA